MSHHPPLEDELKNRFQKLSSPLEPIPTGTDAQLNKLQGIRVIMYDFYGTLFLSGVGDIGVDDGKSDAELMLKALKGAGISVVNKNAGKKALEIYSEVVEFEIKKIKLQGIEYPELDIREVWRKVLEELYNDGYINTLPDSRLNSILSVEFEARMNPVWPVKDAINTLSHFQKMNIEQGIISNSQFYTPLLLEALSGKSLSELGFNSSLLHWSFEEEMKKPGLQFYKLAVKKITGVLPSIIPEQVLYVGNDMLKDIWPASEMGFKTALYAGDKRSLKWRKDDSRCKNLKPDIIITDFSQLSDIIEINN